MKMNRTLLFITISSFSLLMVLIIQVGWILQTAQIKEDLFNEKANMVLARTTEAIHADKETSRKIGACVAMDGATSSAAKLGQQEANKIDSLINYYMNFYNIHVDYKYEVRKPNAFAKLTEIGLTNFIYNKSFENDAGDDGIELKLILPEKKEYIIAEMGTLFITSVILILVVLILFWRTLLSLMNEKKIAEHTTDFLNNMTHEFKTPLTNIALAGKMLIKDSTVPEDAKIKHYSEIILEENEKLRLQVEQVLSMTALERGEIPIRKTELDFHLLIYDAIKHINIQIENNQGLLKLNLEANNFVVMGDKTHIINALCNLIDNAIKYSKENPELFIQTFNRNQHLIILVGDKGIGIDKQYHKKVFDKFFRVPTGDVHDVKGFGLGLAYVKKIIDLHNGTIEFQSEKGLGTTFTIKLPYV